MAHLLYSPIFYLHLPVYLFTLLIVEGRDFPICYGNVMSSRPVCE